MDGKAAEYEWYTYGFNSSFNPSYKRCNEIMKSYAAAIAHHDLLSTTDGTEKRSDGTPVLFFTIV